MANFAGWTTRAPSGCEVHQLPGQLGMAVEDAPDGQLPEVSGTMVHIPAIWDPLAPVGQQGLVPNRPLPAELWEYKTGSHYVLALGASHHESHVMQCMFVCCHAVRFMPCCFMNVMQHQVLHAMCIKNESIAMIII